MPFIKELFSFLRGRKKLWMLPIILLVALGALMAQR